MIIKSVFPQRIHANLTSPCLLSSLPLKDHTVSVSFTQITDNLSIAWGNKRSQ